MRYKVVLFLAMILFVISSYLGCLSFLWLDPVVKIALVTAALGICSGGIVLVLGWFLLLSPSIISRFRRFGQQSVDSGQKIPNLDPENRLIIFANNIIQILSKLSLLSFTGLVSISLITSGLFTLGWVWQLTWIDLTLWNKDVIQIFFGSRTGESISLGIGMRVIHYLLLGFTLLIFGIATLLYGRLRRSVNTLKNQISNLERRNEELEDCLDAHSQISEQIEELLHRIETLESQTQQHHMSQHISKFFPQEQQPAPDK